MSDVNAALKHLNEAEEAFVRSTLAGHDASLEIERASAHSLAALAYLAAARTTMEVLPMGEEP